MPKRTGDGVSPVQKPPAKITPEPDRGTEYAVPSHPVTVSERRCACVPQ